MACSVSLEIDASSELMRLLIRENNRQHSIFNNGLKDLLGARTLLKFVFHVDFQNRCYRMIACSRPVEKLCITLRVDWDWGVDGCF